MRIFTKTQHISEEALGLHALGDLPELRRQQVTTHLSSCSRCRCEFNDALEFIGIVRQVAKKYSAPLLAATI